MEEVKKPLELVDYGPFKEGPNGLRIVHGPQKRLTDAELAAEYWMSSSRRERMLGYDDGPGSATANEAIKEAGRMERISRFATHDHCDEGDS